MQQGVSMSVAATDDGIDSAGEGPLVIGFADVPTLVSTALPPSGWRTLDQGLVTSFAEATDDCQWIHVDPARAAAEMESGTIVHGFFLLSLIVALTREIVEVRGVSRWINYGLNKVRFLDPVPVGARVRLRQEITSVERRGDAMMLTRACTIETEGRSKPAMVAEWIDLLYPRVAVVAD
jgi:acyl dehydratase